MKITILFAMLLTNAYAETLICRGPLNSNYLQQYTGEETKINVFNLGLRFSTKKAGDQGIHLPKGHCAFSRRPIGDNITSKVIQFNMTDGNYWSENVISDIHRCINNSDCVIELITSTTSTGGWTVNGQHNLNKAYFHRPLKFVPLLDHVPGTIGMVSPR